MDDQKLVPTTTWTPEGETKPLVTEEAVINAICTVYDPEIPVNIYELGLIYKVTIDAATNDVDVKMSLTSPGCPVAGEMPGMVENAVKTVEGVGQIKVEIVWDPAWDPSRMAETAKLQLNMY